MIVSRETADKESTQSFSKGRTQFGLNKDVGVKFLEQYLRHTARIKKFNQSFRSTVFKTNAGIHELNENRVVEI